MYIPVQVIIIQGQYKKKNREERIEHRAATIGLKVHKTAMRENQNKKISHGTYPLSCAASSGASNMRNSKDKTTIIFFRTFPALNSFSSHWICRFPQTFSSENHANSMIVEYGYPLLNQNRLK